MFKVIDMKIMLIAMTLICSLLVCGCKSDRRDVVDEQIEAQKAILSAKKEVAAEKAEARKEIGAAQANGDADEVIDEKIEATKEIGKAERKVEDEKIEATEEITDELRKAGETTGTYKHE